MYKIFCHHCNKCLYPSLWNTALKNLKTILLIKWLEWKKSQNKVQYIAVHTILFIEFHQLFHGGPGGQTTNTTSSFQHATSLGSISRTNIKWGDDGDLVWWLFQPPCDCRLQSCICCKHTQKIKKWAAVSFPF